MKNLEEELKELEQVEAQLLLKYKDQSFNTSAEAQRFIKDNEKELKRLNKVQEAIRSIRLVLMSPKEREVQQAYEDQLKAKYKEDRE